MSDEAFFDDLETLQHAGFKIKKLGELAKLRNFGKLRAEREANQPDTY